MFAGFDYGTSNCAMAVVHETDVKLIPLENDSPYIPSTLYSLDRALIVDAVLACIKNAELRGRFMSHRENALRQASAVKRELGIENANNSWSMGMQAINDYIANPDEGWFVKSPKSFLGATGLAPAQTAFFEDVVTLMMQHVKHSAETYMDEPLDQVVIGRPINFQGIGGEKGNRAATNILTQSAKNAGFKNIDFFYEPLAAGIDFETSLTKDQIVLVLDIGGGTSDCSLIQMGPSHRDKTDRSADFIAHAGTRVGGNDFDISVTYRELMRLLGRGTELKNGLLVPAQYYSNAAKFNDVNAQAIFNSSEYGRELAQLVRDAKQPEQVKRLQSLHTHHQGYQLSRVAEMCKIGLSEKPVYKADLSFIEHALSKSITLEEFDEAIALPLKTITGLLREVLQQADVRPDAVFLTGGTSKSPSVRKAVRAELGEDIPLVERDYFGSVVSGLAKWAARLKW